MDARAKVRPGGNTFAKAQLDGATGTAPQIADRHVTGSARARHVTVGDFSLLSVVELQLRLQRRRRHEQARCSARAWCKLDGALRRRARWLRCLRGTHLAPLRRQTRATDAFLAAATKCVAYAQACGIWCAAELLQLRNLGTWRALLLVQCHQDRLLSDTTRDRYICILARAVA